MMWKVPKTWEGQTAFILAGGPSLKGFDPAALKGKGKIITINDSWRITPKADVHYFCDPQWWQSQMAANRRDLRDSTTSFHDMIYRGYWVNGSRGLAFRDHPQVRQLRLTGQDGLEKATDGLRHGSNSGYQAINLAYLFGATRIVLLGYDMCVMPNGRTHWHDEVRADAFDKVIKNAMLPHFASLVEPLREAGVEVLNANPGSALTVWPRVALADVLAKAQ